LPADLDEFEQLRVAHWMSMRGLKADANKFAVFLTFAAHSKASSEQGLPATRVIFAIETATVKKSSKKKGAAKGCELSFV
jgi:hypothetical protein